MALTDKKVAQLRQARELANHLGVEILAHFFQREEIKVVADFVGGAYEVTDRAVNSRAPAILVCGAIFMHEAIRARRPTAKLLIPRSDISCPLATTVSLEDVQAAKHLYPEALIVADLKVPPAILALAEVKISPKTVRAKLSTHPGAVFIALPGPQLLDWAGFGERVVARQPHTVCQVHELAQADDLARARAKHPDALAAAHFLCRPELLTLADFVSDSAGINRFCAESQAGKFIIVSEAGLTEYLTATWPKKHFYETEVELFCPNMKLTNLKSVIARLEKYERGEAE